MKPSLVTRYACLLALVIGPWILAAIKSPGFWAVPNKFSSFQYIAHQVDDEKSDIDILIFGSSVAWTAFDISVLKAEFAKHGHPHMNIQNLSFNWAYADGSLMILKRVLEKRKVGLVFWEVSRSLDVTHAEHPAALYFFDPWKDYSWAKELGGKYMGAYTGALLLSGPRRLVELLNSNQSKGSSNYSEDPHATINEGGSNLTRKPFSGDMLVVGNRNFEEFHPPAPSIVPEKILFQGEKADPRFEPNGYVLSENDEKIINFARKSSSAQGAHFSIFFSVLTPFIDPIPGPHFNNPELAPDKVPMIKTSFDTLFEGYLKPESYMRISQNRGHFNANGAAYVSKAISQALIKLYETEVLHAAP